MLFETREQARAAVNQQDIRTLFPFEKSKSGLYICPICHSGERSNHTGALQTNADGTHITCYANHCFTEKGEDVLGALRCLWGTDENGVFAKMGYEIKRYRAPQDYTAQPSQQPKSEERHTMPVKEEAKADYTDYITRCNRALQTSDAGKNYFAGRGLTPETVERFKLGYDESINAVVIPYGNDFTYYTTRLITEKAYRKPKASEAGSEPLFNRAALSADSTAPIFVVESAICAISVMQAGGTAVALNGTGGNKLMDAIENGAGAEKQYIICLDNDTAGENACDSLCNKFREKGIAYSVANIAGKWKDPNEHLQDNAGAFYKAVSEAQAIATRPDNVKAYIDHAFANDIKLFMSKKISTGFKKLDEVCGGIYTGLYVLGAISSLGKTTFIHQIADQMAAQGKHVLFFSLEQSRAELVAKSISRITAQTDRTKAVSSLAIRNGTLPAQVLQAIDSYTHGAAENISIIEGSFRCDVAYIRNYVERYIRRNGVKPVVIVDYLQILQADAKTRQTTKDAVDSNVTELKCISRDNDIPVFVISSLNRSNYLTPVDFEAFKESGGIEYTADVVWGLQLEVMNDELFDKDKDIKKKREKVKEAKTATPRKVQLVCLKNRYGVSNYSAYFDYDARYDLFTERDNPADRWSDAPII